jgi:hypothetical protein
MPRVVGEPEPLVERSHNQAASKLKSGNIRTKGAFNHDDWDFSEDFGRRPNNALEKSLSTARDPSGYPLAAGQKN